MIITHINQVTPQWLTSVLRRSGALTRGEVAGFDAGDGQGNWSTSASLRLQYSPDAQGELPERLFLKMVDTDLEGEFFGDSEVTYYSRDYVDVENAPLLRCYDGAYSETLQRYLYTQPLPPAVSGAQITALGEMYHSSAATSQASLQIGMANSIRNYMSRAYPGADMSAGDAIMLSAIAPAANAVTANQIGQADYNAGMSLAIMGDGPGAIAFFDSAAYDFIVAGALSQYVTDLAIDAADEYRNAR